MVVELEESERGEEDGRLIEGEEEEEEEEEGRGSNIFSSGASKKISRCSFALSSSTSSKGAFPVATTVIGPSTTVDPLRWLRYPLSLKGSSAAATYGQVACPSVLKSMSSTSVCSGLVSNTPNFLFPPSPSPSKNSVTGFCPSSILTNGSTYSLLSVLFRVKLAIS